MATPDRAIDGVLAVRYAELRRMLLAYLRRHLGDANAAEDLVQDVMAKALSASSASAAAPDNVGAWLMTIARNAMIDHLRAQRPSAELPTELVAEDPPEVHEALLQCLRPMAERLPEPYREAVIAAEFEGVALASLAERERVSLSAIKSRTSRGRVMLREELVRCCQVAVAADRSGLEYDERKLRGCARDPCGREDG